jgi:integrase
MKTTLRVRREGGRWIYAPMIHGARKPRVDVTEYALARGGPRTLRTEETAVQWAAKIQADWLNGRDPRKTPTEQATTTRAHTVADLVAAYRRANAAHPVLDADDDGKAPAPRLKQPAVVWSELRHISEYFGDAAVTDLEDETTVGKFEDELAEGWAPGDKVVERGASGVRHLLVRLRAVVRWGMGQRTPWLRRSPFHRHGVAITDLDDTRSRRLKPRLFSGLSEEAALLVACQVMKGEIHQGAGIALERRILGALELAGRGSDLNRVRVEHVVLKPLKGQPYVTFLGRSRGGGKAKQDRRVPFDPAGPLAQVLAGQLCVLAAGDYVFGDDNGRVVSHYRAWRTARLLAYGMITADGRGRTAESDHKLLQGIDLQFRDLRRECASRWWQAGLDLRRIQLLLGHSTLLMTQRYLQLPEGEDDGAAVAAAMGWDADAAPASTQKPVRSTQQVHKTANRGKMLSGGSKR